MAETPEKSKLQSLDLDDDDEIISLSDAELDTILGSAEITDAPIADIEIDLGGTSGEPLQTSEAPGSKTVAADEPAQVDETVAAGGGFFASDEDETISLPEDELETILDSESEPALEEQVVLPEDELEPILDSESEPALEEQVVLPEDELEPVLDSENEPTLEEQAVLPEDELVVTAEEEPADGEEGLSIGLDSDISPDFSAAAPSLQRTSDDSFVIIDDQPLDSPEMGLDGSPLIVEEEISIDTGMPELDFAREQAARETADESVVELAGDSLGELLDEDAETSISEEQLVPETSLADSEVRESKPEVQSSPAAASSGPETLVSDQPNPSLSPQPPEFSLEEGAAGFESDGVDDLLIEEEPFLEPELDLEATTPDEIIEIEDELIELEPVAQSEDPESLDRTEVVFEDLQDESAASPAAAVQEADDGFADTPAPGEELDTVSLLDEPVAAVPVVDQVEPEDEPVQFMDEEIVFSAHETIPAAELDEPAPAPAEEGLLEEESLNPDLIAEMKDEVLDAPAAGDKPEMEIVAEEQAGSAAAGGLPDTMRDDVRKVLGYLDNLFDELPEAKVKEFANSEYYDIYSRLFKELGI